MEYKLIKHIIREFELSKLNGELDNHLYEMKKFIDDIFNKSNISNDSIGDYDWYVYDNDNYVYFKQKSGYLQCDYYLVWSFFTSLKLYNYDEIRELIHYIVSSIINREVGTPIPPWIQ